MVFFIWSLLVKYSKSSYVNYNASYGSKTLLDGSKNII